MRLEIPYWSPHHNMLVFSYFFFCEENKIESEIYINKMISANGAVLYINNETFYFDYSDNTVFIENPLNYNHYFKRSLLINDVNQNIFPLNFQANYSYKSLCLLPKFGLKQLMKKANRIEIIRSLDYFNSFTNSSHNAMDIRKLPTIINDNNGRIIFHTRLWNPDNHNDSDEKERRRLQNEFRIEACRIIKKNFDKVSVGLFPDKLAMKSAPDLLLDVKKTSIKKYFGYLRQYGVARRDRRVPCND